MDKFFAHALKHGGVRFITTLFLPGSRWFWFLLANPDPGPFLPALVLLDVWGRCVFGVFGIRELARGAGHE